MESTGITLDRTRQPETQALRHMGLLKPERRKMANGVALNIIRAGKEDVVRLDIIFRGGRYQQSFQLQAMMANRTGSARKPLTIMPGSGINPDNIRELAMLTGVSELHFSATVRHKSGMRVLGGIAKEEAVVHSDESIIRRAITALHQ